MTTYIKHGSREWLELHDATVERAKAEKAKRRRMYLCTLGCMEWTPDPDGCEDCKAELFPEEDEALEAELCALATCFFLRAIASALVPASRKAVRQAIGAAIKPDAGPQLRTPGEARRDATVEGWTS